MAITYTIGSLISGKVASMLGTRVLHLGIVIASIGCIWVLYIVQTGGTQISVLSMLPLAVMGFGNAFVATPLPAFLIAVAGNDAAGAASGAISTAQQLGAAVGVALMGVIFFSVLGMLAQGASSYTGAFAASLLYGTLAICVIQMGLALMLPRKAQG
jgi:hypothetical protein